MWHRCRHLNLRCVHGDEINVRGARTACLDCGKHLKRIPLLYYCYYTGELHTIYGTNNLLGESILQSERDEAWYLIDQMIPYVEACQGQEEFDIAKTEALLIVVEEKRRSIKGMYDGRNYGL